MWFSSLKKLKPTKLEQSALTQATFKLPPLKTAKVAWHKPITLRYGLQRIKQCAISGLLIGGLVTGAVATTDSETHTDAIHEHHDHEDHSGHGHAGEHEDHSEHGHADDHEDHSEHGRADEHETQAHQSVVTQKRPANINTDLSLVPAVIRQKTDVAVSNYPLFLLSQAVTKGAPSATLLLDEGGAGHHGSLSPADMKTIKDSRYVVWFGEQLENNLAKPLANASNNISLLGLNAFHRRPLRDIKGQDIAGSQDPHIWLDPENAKAITRALGAIFARANPAYQSIYERNVVNFAQQMDDAVAKAHLANPNMTKRPYWAYHDSFGYIEPTLQLAMVGALTQDHHLAPKASQYQWLQKNRPQPVMCIILQTDSNKSALSKLAPVKSRIQNEDMSASQSFVEGWQNLADSFNGCIEDSQG